MSENENEVHVPNVFEKRSIDGYLAIQISTAELKVGQVVLLKQASTLHWGIHLVAVGSIVQIAKQTNYRPATRYQLRNQKYFSSSYIGKQRLHLIALV